MARLVATGDSIFSMAGNLLYRFSLPSMESTSVNLQEISERLPKIAKPRADAENQENVAEDEPSVDFQNLCLAISPCSRLLAVGTSHKTVVVLDVATFTSPRAFRIPKAPTSICFDQDSLFVVVGDRAGHVCRYSVEAPTKIDGHKDITGEICYFEGEALMGAISMVLDVAVSPDNRHLLVADRDEKVRIHRYPKAYVVESLGLGHTHYVSSISFLDGRLFSSGGDSQLKEWNLEDGRELSSITLVENGPIKKILAVQMGTAQYIVAFADKTADLIIFDSKTSTKRILQAPSELLDICQYNGAVYAISRSGLLSFPDLVTVNSHDISEEFVQKLAGVKEPIASYFKNVTHKNMEEYYLRKAEKMSKGKEKKQKHRKRKNQNVDGSKQEEDCEVEEAKRVPVC